MFKRLLIVWICFLVFMPLARAQEEEAGSVPEQPVSIRVDPYLQDATPERIWVAWETDREDESIVEYGETVALGQSVTGIATPSSGNARIHHVELVGLKPGTKYFYRVITGNAVSGVFDFNTPPLASEEESFRFAVYSDTQADGGNPAKHEEVVNDGIIAFIKQAFGTDLAAELAFILNAGDLVDDGQNYGQWASDFFGEAQNLFRHVPLYPVLGNHERNSDLYFKYFHLPENGTAGYSEHWYHKDYGNVRVIGLDSNGAYQLKAQLDWLDGVLANATTNDDIDFVFAQLHHPHKSEFWTPGNTPWVGEVVRRLEAFSSTTSKPSAHFFGHTHAYSRGQSRDHQHLWVNVASGAGNIDYWGEYPQADYPEFQRSFPDWGFVLVEVDAGPNPQFRLRRISRGNETKQSNNEVLDDITIRFNNKSPAAPTPLDPPAGAQGVSVETATLQGSAYSDPDNDAHIESHVQLTTQAGQYGTGVAEFWTRFENWYAPQGASGPGNGWFSVNTVTDPDVSKIEVSDLEPHTQYFWRIRYRDAGLVWSEWSAESNFTTGKGDPRPKWASVWNFEQGFAAGKLGASTGPGHWEFWDNAGSGFAAANTTFGTTTSFGISPIGGEAADAMHAPRFLSGNDGYLVFHEAPSNGNGRYLNEYTLVYDINVPASTFTNGQSNWIALYNSNCCNGNDAEAFVQLSSGGIGIAGDYVGRVLPDTWHRVTISVDLSSAAPTMFKYIDGTLVGQQTLSSGLDGRWSLYTTSDGDPYDTFHLLSDDSGDTDALYVSSFGFIDRVLTQAEVEWMGRASASGLMFPSTGCYPDCEISTGTGILDIFDFLCFQNSFVGGEPYACDCDTSTGSGECDVFDFLCFQNAFVGGCP